MASMLGFTRAFSSLSHGSRYAPCEPFEGVMKKKTRDPILGSVLGMLKGKSVSANWDEYYFKLVPGAPCEPSLLQYFEVTSAEGAASVTHAPTPTGAIYLDFRCAVHEQGKSASHGLFKFEIVGGKSQTNEEKSWNLKVLNEATYRRWVAALTAVCTTRWEANVAACRVCKQTFSALAGRLSHHCRYCGRCVCGVCSPASRCLPREGLLPVRVCAPCYKELGPSDGVLG